MASAPFATLPNDILVEILVQVKRVSETNNDLISCLRVCRRWNEAGTPILYGNIALNHSNHAMFHERFNESKCGSLVRSLTVSIQAGEEEQLDRLVRLLSQLENLASFSLRLIKGYSNAQEFPETPLVNLVNALPATCTNLELDTDGFDTRTAGVQHHLCDDIRKTLPRMQHVRLRTRTCERLFTAPPGSNEPLSLPNIRTLIVSCSRLPGAPIAVCELGPLPYVFHGFPHLSWDKTTSSLEKLVDVEGAVPKDAKVYAFITSDKNDNNYSLWQAHIRADMCAKESWAMPIRSIWPEYQIPGSSLIRLPDGQELMATPYIVEDLAEGRLWRDVVGGVRLPAAVLEDERLGKPSFATGCVEAPVSIKTTQQWRQENPRKGFLLLINEKKTEMQLVGAEKRSGKDKYLSLDQVLEITPPGWNRGVNDRLEKAET